ncbi:Gamma-glutamyl hydrolase, partial [Stegodyphus mimosarum]
MFFFGVTISVCVVFTSCMSINPLNDRPIIGIVTEEVNSTFVPNAKSNIYASYVKFLEAGGARVVPIMIYKSKQYYRDLLSKINGVLFPGGGNILRSKGFGRTGKLIFDIATEMNDKGDFFPLWGTCLGFELLNYLAAKKLWMKACAAEDLPSNLNFVEGFKNSRMFQDLDVPLQKSMQNENITINYHQWCLTPQNYTLSGLNKYFKVLALSQDSRNLTYVSVVEGYKYPYYGVAFHPEKVMFEWVLSKTHHNIPHNAAAIRVSQYFANFFVNEARKSTHKFSSKEMEDAVLIYNYNPVFTGKRGNNPVVQNYYFT